MVPARAKIKVKGQEQNHSVVINLYKLKKCILHQ